MCIGKALAIAVLRHLARGFLRHLPDSVSVNDNEIELDGSNWLGRRYCFVSCGAGSPWAVADAGDWRVMTLA